MLEDGPILISCLFIFFGTLISLSYCYSKSNIRFGEEYARINGEIIRSTIKEKHFWGKTTTFYKADIKYTYHVDGVKYESGHIFKNSEIFSSSDVRRAETVINRYYLNKSINIYYSPSDHSKSYLQESMELPFQYFSTGTIFIVIGITVLWYV